MKNVKGVSPVYGGTIPAGVWRDFMTQALEELGKEQKLCVTLFYLEKRSYQEIVDKTGFTLMQVKSHIQNGKRNLKLLMEKKAKEKNLDWIRRRLYVESPR